ncbi:MAG: 4,5-DOPA dioxygenase extradiol [Candidatus Gracilibacteria bacterium]|nr:4,5-DOPA dioxygenase extradiol [Candidatus Gracilibacteria bacterium]
MTPKQPLLFIGHGSPMNAIEDTQYTREWQRIGKTLGTPRALLMISAHWITEGETRIATAEHPEMIYDMYGFPEELYQVDYPTSGSAAIANEILALFSAFPIQSDSERGFDHGVWSVLVHLFPEHNIPVIALSLDYDQPPEWHYEFGKILRMLREQGILIIASGNTVHNLSKVSFGSPVSYDWAREFDERIQKGVREKNYEDIVDFRSWGTISKLAHPTYDHLLPLIVALGAVRQEDSVAFFAQGIDLGSVAMTSMIWK